MQPRALEILEALRQFDQDGKLGPNAQAQPTHVLVAKLRLLGQTGGDKLLREAVRRFRGNTPRGWLTRHQAAARLGLSVQRIDQLRREGRIAWVRNPHTRAILINVGSLEAYRRSQGPKSPTPDRPLRRTMEPWPTDGALGAPQLGAELAEPC